MFFSLEVSNVVLFICVFKESVYDVLAPWKKKENMKERCFLVFFCFFFCFECYCFCLEWIKIKPYFANKAKSFFTDFFFAQDSYVYFYKNILRCIETWVRVCCYICHLCLYLLFCFANLCYQGDIPYLTRKKSWRRLYIFLKPRSMKVRYFKLTCWYTSFLIVNSVLFRFGSYPRETSLHLSETWVEGNVSFSTSIFCTNLLIHGMSPCLKQL